jgi:hypothetical protein
VEEKEERKGGKKRRKGKEVKAYQASLHTIGLDHDEGKLGSHGCLSREVRRRRCKGNAREREREREKHTHTKQRRSVRSFISLTFHPQDDKIRDLNGFFNEND